MIKKSEYFFKRLNVLSVKYNFIKEVRGKGLLIGLVLDPAKVNSTQLYDSCLKNQLLVLQAGSNVVRIAPSLNIKDSDINQGLDYLEQSLSSFS